MQNALIIKGELVNHQTIKLNEPLPISDGEIKIIVEIPQRKKTSRKEFCGILKGKISISEDFNSPLEDFKEYME